MKDRHSTDSEAETIATPDAADDGYKKNLPKQVFLSAEHIARRYVFKRFAIIFKHAFQDFAQFHAMTPTILLCRCYRLCAYSMTAITKINYFVI